MKLVVWDLDETIWDGTFMYDGLNVKLRPNVANSIKRLDNVGVLQSVISRNSQDVWSRVISFGFGNIFVMPKLTWGRKDLAMETLINEMHILPKDVVYVDDDITEAEEMKYAWPDISITDSKGIEAMIPLKATGEFGEERKQFFKAEEKRLLSPRRSTDEFFRFLDLGMEIKKPTNYSEWDRVLELINRSNQLHSTGSRYESVQELWDKHKDSETFIAYPRDKYGDYGLSLIAVCEDMDDYVAIDELVVSCRVMERELLAPFLKTIQNRFKRNRLQIKFRNTGFNGVLMKQLLEIVPTMPHQPVGEYVKNNEIRIEAAIQPKVEVKIY